jgi:RNA polymerase sigma-54 factor
MWMQQRISLKLSQKPVLTQSLRQLVKLLALNKLELKEEINQELTENPILEISGEAEADQEAEQSLEEISWNEEHASNPADREVLEAAGIVARNGDAAAGTEGISKSAAEAAPAEVSEPAPDPFDDIDLDSYFQDYLDPGFRSPLGEISERPSFETFLAKPVTLTDHLLWQLSLSHVSDAVAEAAECVIGNLNEDGYLTAQLDEMGRVAGISIEDIEAGLALVQEFDPLGVAARDVAECLLIQLRASDADTGVAGEIVTHFQQQLQDGNLAEIATRMRRPLRHIETAVALIRNLDPRPGQRYNSTSARAVEPDVQFVKTPNGFEVALNEDDLPDLRLNRQYRRLLEKGNSSKEVRNYVKERYHSAIQLLRNIEQRRQTIRNVCEAIVKRQTAFLAHGLEHLRPMMIKDVAEEIGVHPSTVSRAVANKYAYTPHGVYELRFFFSEAVQGPAGASVPLLLLKRKVKKMIGEENPAHPLTDDHISKMLRDDGIQVTRRTVAKYREDLQIPSTHRRRRRG